ncbi:MAG: methylated-DNA--[protein]-cysteine S-methyltransferase [Myxococcales bacterium]|nr:methylated-DNA--[protein]-cysteine S-methyltransferase [Myxococcales bacterium]
MTYPSRFTQRVYDAVRLVPRGRVTTYSAVATLVLAPRAARAVGQALRAGKWEPGTVPWHRVINAQGEISFKGDLVRATRQRALLEEEGIAFDEAERVNLDRFGWWG